MYVCVGGGIIPALNYVDTSFQPVFRLLSAVGIHDTMSPGPVATPEHAASYDQCVAALVRSVFGRGRGRARLSDAGLPFVLNHIVPTIVLFSLCCP